MSFSERLRPYLDRAREYRARAGDAIRRGWVAVGPVGDYLARADRALGRAVHAAARAIGRVGRATWRALAAFIARMRARRAARAAVRASQPPRRRRGAISPDAAIIVARPEDDLASITGRIDTADDLEIALVIPRSARRLRRASVWPHIAAHTRRRGIVLSVASTRRDVRAHARANGLRTASRLRQLQRGEGIPIPFADVRLPALPMGGFMRFAVVAAIVVGLGVLALYRVPTATVTIVPVAEAYSTTRSVSLSPIAEASNIETNVVRAGSVRETITTLITAETTGQTEVGDAFATVTLVFGNESAEDLEITAGTSISDGDTVTFLTDEDLDVPAGGDAEVTATAADPGTFANVEANVLTQGNRLPDGVSVTNPAAAAGGTNRVARAVHEDDVVRVREIADNVLRTIAERSLEEMLGEDAVIFPETMSTAIFSEVPLQQLDEPADVLLVEYVIVVSVIVLRPEMAADFGVAMIEEELPPELALLPGTTTVRTVGSSSIEAGHVRVTLEATGMVADRSGIETLPEELAGLRPADAEQLIAERFALQGPPHIEIHPGLIPWRWLPRSAERIEIELAGPDFFLEEDEEEDEEEDDDLEDLEIPEEPRVRAGRG